MPRFYSTAGPEDPGMGFAFLHADNGRHHSLALGEGRSRLRAAST
jgi:3,4-dihydroxy-9,10-secoandrosta-1,3,5(10)-triene-9,17-dione 4,5-dioxygenase